MLTKEHVDAHIVVIVNLPGVQVPHVLYEVKHQQRYHRHSDSSASIVEYSERELCIFFFKSNHGHHIFLKGTNYIIFGIKA